MTSKISIAIFYSFLFGQLLMAQSDTPAILTLQEATSMALKANDNLEISRLGANLDEMQVYKANAGYSPRLDWNVNMGSSFNNVNQEFLDGRKINRFGRAFSPNTNLALSWNIFDGNRKQTRYNILMALSDRSKLSIKEMEDFLVYQVANAYYSMAKQKETITYLQTVIKFYAERVKITEERWQIGRGSKLDFLQSQNDLNAQLAAIQNAQISLDNQKVIFNLLLGRVADIPFETETIPASLELYDQAVLFQKALDNDESLMLFDKDLAINELRVKELEGARLPQINLSTALGYSLSNTNAGLVLINKNLGLTAGISSSWNIFDGKQNKRQSQIAGYRSKIISRQKEAAISSIKSDIALSLNQYNASSRLLAVEENNKQIAEENLQISLEKFRLGGSTILDLNEAQQRYDSALNRYVEAFYDVRFAELELQRIVR